MLCGTSRLSSHLAFRHRSSRFGWAVHQSNRAELFINPPRANLHDSHLVPIKRITGSGIFDFFYNTAGNVMYTNREDVHYFILVCAANMKSVQDLADQMSEDIKIENELSAP